MVSILKWFKGFRPFTIFTEWGLAPKNPCTKFILIVLSVWLLRNIFPLLQFKKIMHPYLIPILKTLANSNSSCNCSWPGSVVTFLKCLLLMGVKLWNGFCRVVGAITGRRHPRLLTRSPTPLARFYIVISWSEVQHTQADSKHRSDIWGSILFIHKYKLRPTKKFLYEVRHHGITHILYICF